MEAQRVFWESILIIPSHQGKADGQAKLKINSRELLLLPFIANTGRNPSIQYFHSRLFVCTWECSLCPLCVLVPARINQNSPNFAKGLPSYRGALIVIYNATLAQYIPQRVGSLSNISEGLWTRTISLEQCLTQVKTNSPIPFDDNKYLFLHLSPQPFVQVP